MGVELAVSIGLEDFRDEDFRCFDGVWKLSHDGLARVMGMTRAQGLADKIVRHLKWLNEISRVHTVCTRPPSGGYEWTQYWLDQPHCIYLLAKSEMPIANDITVRVVKMFDRLVRGELSAAPRMEIRVLEVAAQQIVAPILAEQRQFHSEVLNRMDRTEGRVCTIEEKVSRIEDASSRFLDRPFALKTRRLHIAVVESEYNGMCPCCRGVRIVEGGEKLPNCNDEHFRGRQKNAPEDTWISCVDCNQNLRDPDFHASKYGYFQSYQDARRAYQARCAKQQSLPFGPAA